MALNDIKNDNKIYNYGNYKFAMDKYLLMRYMKNFLFVYLYAISNFELFMKTNTSNNINNLYECIINMENNIHNKIRMIMFFGPHSSYDASKKY